MFKEKAQSTLEFFTHEPGFKTFSSKGHKKAGKLNFTLDYPNGWFAKESKKSNTLQVFWEYPSTYCDSIAIIIPPGQNLEKAAVTHEKFKTFLRTQNLPAHLVGQFPIKRNY